MEPETELLHSMQKFWLYPGSIFKGADIPKGEEFAMVIQPAWSSYAVLHPSSFSTHASGSPQPEPDNVLVNRSVQS